MKGFAKVDRNDGNDTHIWQDILTLREQTGSKLHLIKSVINLDSRLKANWGDWPTEIVEAANQTLCESYKVREQAVIRLGKLGNPLVAPYLANLLLDDHWKVRVATVRALAQLRGQVPFSGGRGGKSNAFPT